jgi:expansin
MVSSLNQHRSPAPARGGRAPAVRGKARPVLLGTGASCGLVAAIALGACSAPTESDGPVVDVPRFEGGTNPLNPSGGTSGAPSSSSSGGVAASCLAGGARCKTGDSLETCNSAGTGFDVSTCDGDNVCLAGACRPLTCTPGETLCLGSEIHACNADRKSTSLITTCAAGQTCRPTTKVCEPLVCNPLEGACNGNRVTRCDATGFGYDFSVNTDCGAQACSAGVCRDPESIVQPGPLDPNQPIITPPTQVSQACTANQISCVGNSLNTCNAQGTGITAQACGTGTCNATTVPPSCVAAPKCTPGAVSCEGANTIGTCAADGSAVTTTRCPDGSNCTGTGQCTPVRCNPAGLLSHNGNGGVTVYWFAQGTLGSPRQEGQDVNCSFNATRANNDDGGQMDRVAYAQDPALFGAMNLAEYAGAAACGACVQLTQGGRNVTITVSDSCNPAINNNGTCTNGHIDLSRTAFQQLTGQGTGDINGITWRYVPCDTVDNVQFLLKKADDEYWNEFLVLGHRYPIVKAEVKMEDGRWLQARREAFNYWLPPEGDGPGGDMGTYRVRVTDINGGIVEEQLALRGGLQGGSGQFECQP